jgi:WD40 repeat protein
LPYLALEYVDGPSLHAALVAHGPYSWPETRALLIQLTQGLADANAAGVIHRDVKPSNVLMGPDGVARLTDFGIARGLDLTRMTATSTLLGTPAYMAPEGPKDARSDLYSLGIIGYELLTGAVPFKGTSYQEVVVDHIRTPPDLSKLPAEARSTIGWLLEKDPAARPQRASELLPVLYGATQAPQTTAARAAEVLARAAVEAPEAPAPTVVVAPPPVVPAVAVPALKPARPQRPVEPVRSARQSAPPPVPALRRRAMPLVVGSGVVALVVCVASLVLAGGLATPKSSPTKTAARPTATGHHSLVATAQTPVRGQFSPTGSMSVSRHDQTATLLSDGQVLIAGGQGNDGSLLASAELYDPKSGTFSPTGSMIVSRYGQTATLLSDGRVLIAGGFGGHALAELYDPRSGKFSPTGPMTIGRQGHTATLLSDGRVLVAGGLDCPIAVCTNLASAEVYDPNSGTFSPTASMSVFRYGQTATLRSDGRVLIAGGQGNGNVIIGFAELYDPKSGTFSPTGSMIVSGYGQTATLLSDGRVLIAGGDADGYLASTELYDPRSGKFSPTGSMGVSRYGQTATLLSDGRVLIAGGRDASAEVYDPKSGTFSPTGSMGVSRVGQTATLLSDGRVLIAGGVGGHASAEIYTP